ncbi:hypothetical protein [Methylobacterium thuringiense]|uniref:Uncharacterized protein n=1 Tax=Methylobacterium thuringiense TaxID=1003091 RepID=A0ABQ4TFW1_9HYPH|nr:hypothetical protein [Methylobacterium thuringiense]GJE53811.1 hypothetical protein EKPJFOCH_0279 [Methylobacterium thuringiense]
MSTNLRLPRILEDDFVRDLIAGPLTPLLTLVQQDRDLIAEIRTDILDVYCKGQRLVSVKRLREGYRLLSHKKFWDAQSLDVRVAEQVAAFCKTEVPDIKQSIALHAARGREIEFEQLLIRVNNRENLNSDYIAVDRQGIAEEGKGRTDVVGVYWPGDRRITNNALAPALIEVKFGLGGGVEGVAAQLSRYFEDLRGTLPTFARDLQGQLRQKARLGLLNGLSDLAQAKIQRLPVSDRIKDMRAVVVLVDYNPRAGRLDLGALRALPFADQIDLFHLGFGLWRANSTFRVELSVAASDDWLTRVCAGAFDAIPNPFAWIESIEFARLINGHEAARTIGVTELGNFANAKLANAEAIGAWAGTPLELWLCLFYEHRLASHGGKPVSYAEGRRPIRDLLCQSLRNTLQRLSPTEHAEILRLIASKE